MKNLKRILFIAIPATAFAAGLLLQQSASGKESLCPKVVAVEPGPQRASGISAEGRVVAYPGADVLVGADFAGRVARVLVDEKANVKKGDLLAEIDASEERASLEQARSRITESDADLKLAESEVARASELLDAKVGTAQALDRAERDRDAALSRRATARADAERLSALVARSRIVAPIAGVVLERQISAGETVARGAGAFRLADLSRIRVEAEVDESESERIRPGAPAGVRTEEEPGKVFAGHVEEIPDAVRPRKTKPLDPGKPVDTRVLLVKVALDGPAPLKLGRRVEVVVDVN